ncbi:hypothetical protein [Taklimakanibacter albus]|nr:hypothetical protein [Aestuariivirga sp. YIM B02566]
MSLIHRTILTLRCLPKAGLEGAVAAVSLYPDGRFEGRCAATSA